jgi:hypothetical protein
MRAMDKEPPRPHRTETRKGGGNPVAFTDLVEAHRAGGRVTRDNGNEGTNIRFVRRVAEIDFDGPGPLVPAACVRCFFESGGGGRRRIKGFDNNIGDTARRRLVAGEAHDMRGAIWGQAFEHGGS